MKESKDMDALKIRQKRAYRLLREAGFDKAIVGDPMSIQYLTGIHVIPYERYYGLVLDAQKEEIVMLNPSVDTGCMKGGVPECTYLDEDGPKEVIRKAVNDCKVLAVEKKYFSMAVGEIYQSLDCRIEDIGDCIARLRMFKDEQEIETMQMAAKIVDEAIAHVSKRIRPGITENQLNMMLLSYMAEYPGFSTEDIIILVLGAENSANPHGVSGDYVLKDGDIVLMDFCAYYKGYWSDITRCLFLGKVGDPKLEEIYEIVKEANLAAIKAVKPGVKAKDIDGAAREVITKAGFGEFFLHRTGHGLGLSVHEEPYITSVNELVLEEGMTFTIEPGIYLEGIGGVRIEDDILVTESGCRILTSSSKELEDNIVRY